jgi:hypothetical protein
MAWYGRYGYNTAGDLKNFFDYIITNYGQDENGYGWTIKDANAGTNIGVYQCHPDANSKFVLVIKDNQTNYANVEYWDDWNADSHSGVGNSMTYGCNSSYNLQIWKRAGQWFASIDKDRIVYVSLGMNMAYYLGYPDRFDITKDTPIFVGWDNFNSAQNGGYNPLGYWGNSTSYPEWRAFRSAEGNYNVLLYYYPAGFIALSPDGRYICLESLVVAGNFCIGKLKGVFVKTTTPPIVYSGQQLQINGTKWFAVRASSGGTEYGMCYVRES